MRVYKCDACGKTIQVRSTITAGVGYSQHDLCEKCGEPIVKVLKKYKLVGQKED